MPGRLGCSHDIAQVLYRRGVVRCHFSRGFSTKPVLPTPAENTPSATSGFLESFGVLLEEPKKTGVVGRWDWHLWQVFVMLLPPLGIAGLAYFARHDMRKQEAILFTKKQEMEEEEQRVIQEEASRMQSTRDTQSAAERQQQAKVEARLEDLERAVRSMHAKRFAQQITGTNPHPDDAQRQPHQPSANQAADAAVQMTGAEATWAAAAHAPEAAVTKTTQTDKPSADIRSGSLAPTQRQADQANLRSTGDRIVPEQPAQVLSAQADTASVNANTASEAHNLSGPGHNVPVGTELGDNQQSSFSPEGVSTTDQSRSSSGNAGMPSGGVTQPTAVAAVRQFARGQIQRAFGTVKEVFTGSSADSRQQAKQDQRLKKDES